MYSVVCVYCVHTPSLSLSLSLTHTHTHKHTHTLTHGLHTSDGQRDTPAKRRHSPASNDNGRGPKVKQPKLLDCLFDDELSPVQVEGRVINTSVCMHIVQIHSTVIR